MQDHFIQNFSSDILPEKFLTSYINKVPPFGFNGLGYIVYKRTYARLLPDNTTEEWWQTVARCINGAQKIGARYTKEEAQELFDLMFNLKCSYAGRMLWQLGTSTVDRFGANSLLNCWFTLISKQEDCNFLFENLMLGGGVGFSVRRDNVYELPKVKTGVNIEHKMRNDTDFIVPDSREGWIELLRKVLDAYLLTGKNFTYSTILVRGAGEKINGFGGTASGPKILIDGIENICKILKGREGKKLRSIDVLDIENIIGTIVVAGNVRRSAQIAIGDPDDHLFLRAKRWDLGKIPNWRAMSNNTIAADSYDQIANQVWDGFNGNGEAYGFLNLPLINRFGRLGDHRKDHAVGINPCGEIPLADKECCNLSEVFLNNITSEEELVKCATLLYKTQKAICAMNYIHEETNNIVHKNMRIGVSVTGICQSLNKLSWLPGAYDKLRDYDVNWSDKNGWNKSIRLTTIKPSGTVSLLAGATPGIHPGFAQYFIRRIRMASTDSLVDTCRDSGYEVEYAKNFDGTEDHSTIVVSFPCEYSQGTILAENMTAVEQLEMIVNLQTLWSDNAVSATVYYRKEELPDIKQWMEKNYEKKIKSVSFLLHSDHGFIQAPYEQIDEKKYNKMLRRIKSIETVNVGDDLESMECANGVCPIK